MRDTERPERRRDYKGLIVDGMVETVIARLYGRLNLWGVIGSKKGSRGCSSSWAEAAKRRSGVTAASSTQRDDEMRNQLPRQLKRSQYATLSIERVALLTFSLAYRSGERAHPVSTAWSCRRQFELEGVGPPGTVGGSRSTLGLIL